MGIFFFLFVSSNLSLFLIFLNTEQHHFYSRIWNNTSSKWVKKTSHKMTATGRGALEQLKHCTNAGAITEEPTQNLSAGDGKPISYVGRAKAWISALLELPASPDLVTVTTTSIFFPMPIPQHIQALLNIHGHNRAPRWIRIISQKMCWGREKRDRYIHTALNFLILSMCRNTTKQKS